MDVSLTKDEFLERFAEQRALIQFALCEELKETNPLIKVRFEEPDSITLVLGEVMGSLISRILFQTVELIYQEQ